MAALRLWPGWTAPVRPKARGRKRPRVVRPEATDEPATDAPAREPFSIEALLEEHPPHDWVPSPLTAAEPIYETFEPESWRVPIPDPAAPSSLPRTLREVIGDDPDELERWAELKSVRSCVMKRCRLTLVTNRLSYSAEGSPRRLNEMDEDQKRVIAAADVMVRHIKRRDPDAISMDDLVRHAAAELPDFNEETLNRALWSITSRGIADLTWDGKLRLRIPA